MRLLIISHTRHHLHQGNILGWGPTVEEIGWLSCAFNQVFHLAYLCPELPPRSSLPYRNENVSVVTVPPSGGRRWQDKARVIALGPHYIRTIRHWLSLVDVVHIRAPCPIALYAMILLAYRDRPLRWTKYAGNWGEANGLPLSFAFQRWWLKMGFSRGPVTVNGRWRNQPRHIFSFDNPSLSLEEVRRSRSLSIKKTLNRPVRLVFAGRLEKDKGIYASIRVMKKLISAVEACMDVIGDGPEAKGAMRLCEQLGLTDRVIFHGWQPRQRVKQILGQAHFVLLPSRSEGFPKVLSEAMGYGAVPLASKVSAIPQVLEETGAGFCFSPEDIDGFASAISELSNDSHRWKQMSLAGIRAAVRFTYEQYILALDGMFKSYYGASPLNFAQVEKIREQIALESEHSAL